MNYDNTKIVQAIEGLVGYDQTVDTATYPSVDAGLLPPVSLQSVSQEAPAFLTSENIFHTMEGVSSNPQNIDGTLFNTLLDNKRKAAATNVAQDLRTLYVSGYNTKAVLEDRTIFKGAGSLRDKVTNNSSFVGWTIELKNMRNACLNIKRIGFQSSAIESFNMYLFHSSQPVSIATIPVTTAGVSEFTWNSSTEALKFTSPSYDSGGYFLLGYYQNDLTGEAINRANQQTNPIRSGCPMCADGLMFKKLSKYASFSAFKFTDNTVNALPDLATNARVSRNTYGMNIDFSITCDVTDFFVQRAVDFTDALKKKMAVLLLQDMAYNSQVDGRAQINKQLATDLHLIKEGEYKEALKALSFNFSGLDEPCLPCVEKRKRPKMRVF